MTMAPFHCDCQFDGSIEAYTTLINALPRAPCGPIRAKQFGSKIAKADIDMRYRHNFMETCARGGHKELKDVPAHWFTGVYHGYLRGGYSYCFKCAMSSRISVKKNKTSWSDLEKDKVKKNEMENVEMWKQQLFTRCNITLCGGCKDSISEHIRGMTILQRTTDTRPNASVGKPIKKKPLTTGKITVTDTKPSYSAPHPKRSFADFSKDHSASTTNHSVITSELIIDSTSPSSGTPLGAPVVSVLQGQGSKDIEANIFDHIKELYEASRKAHKLMKSFGSDASLPEDALKKSFQIIQALTAHFKSGVEMCEVFGNSADSVVNETAEKEP